MSALKERIQHLLSEAGYENIRRSIGDLAVRAREMAENAGNPALKADGFSRFEAFPSYIPLLAPDVFPEAVLTIDIGGTFTKGAIRLRKGDNFEWRLLFHSRNEDFIEAANTHSDNSFECFATALAQHAQEQMLVAQVSPESISHCGIVWSNSIENKPADFGITALIVQREMYKKGEWFVEDLKNGTDLGQVFMDAFAPTRIGIGTLLIANDTPVTLTACEGNADAGMVASTGLNGTLVKTLSELGLAAATRAVICNAEIGGRMRLGAELVTEADLAACGESSVTIEYLSAGKFLPRCFTGTVELLAKSGINELQPFSRFAALSEGDSSQLFRSRHISSLLADQEVFRADFGEWATSSEAVEALRVVAEKTVERSALLCGLVAYATVANRIADVGTATVAVDSRLAREMPLFLKVMQETAAGLMRDQGSISLQLLTGILTEKGKIAVPMQGAASALDRLASQQQ